MQTFGELRSSTELGVSADLRDLVQNYVPEVDSRWPNRTILKKYREITDSILRTKLSTAGASSDIILRELKSNFQKDLSTIDETNSDSLSAVIRMYSCLASMLMHLALSREGKSGVRIDNTRRNRTPYSSYPTSPMIGMVAAKYIWDRLSETLGPDDQVVNICDPTMEGAPLLWEVVFHRLKLERGERATLRSPILEAQTRIIGFDKNSISTSFFSFLSKKATEYLTCDGFNFQVLNRESLSGLQTIPKLHAVVNNPPWGRTTDNSNLLDLGEYGPFRGYRDPYIAFVSTSISRLSHGFPFAFVLPYQLLNAPSAYGLREELEKVARIDLIVELPEKCFPRATLKTVLVLGIRRQGSGDQTFNLIRFTGFESAANERKQLLTRAVLQKSSEVPGCPWLIAQKEPSEKAKNGLELGTAVHVMTGLEPYGVGKGSPRQTIETVRDQLYTFDQPQEGTLPVVRGRSVKRFHVVDPKEHIKIGAWLAYRGLHDQHANSPRVFVRQICSRSGDLSAAVAPSGVVGRRGVLTLVCNEIEPELLAAFLNSPYMKQQVPLLSLGFHKESFNRVTASALRSAEAPAALFSGRCGERGHQLRSQILSLAVRIGRAVGNPMADAETELNELLEAAMRVSE